MSIDQGIPIGSSGLLTIGCKYCSRSALLSCLPAAETVWLGNLVLSNANQRTLILFGECDVGLQAKKRLHFESVVMSVSDISVCLPHIYVVLTGLGYIKRLATYGADGHVCPRSRRLQ